MAVSPLWSICGVGAPSPVTSVARCPISGFARLTLKKSPLAYALKLEGAFKGKQTYLPQPIVNGSPTSDSYTGVENTYERRPFANWPPRPFKQELIACQEYQVHGNITNAHSARRRTA